MDSAAAVRGLLGTVETEAGTLGIGPGYRVDVEGDGEGFRVRPALGRGQETPAHLGFELTSLARESGAALPVGNLGFERGPAGLTLLREGGTIEQLELTPEGVKHSVILDSAPAGGGDLVARFALDPVGLAPAAEAGPGRALEFRASSGGGLFVGEVLGVDAAGREVDGQLRLVGDVLELRLPGEFVDAADYPLVIDPLIGPLNLLGTDELDERPDVAWCATEETYLMVFNSTYSSGESDILGQRLDAAGQLVGGLIPIETELGVTSLGPRVAANNGTRTFAVVYQQEGFTKNVFLRVRGIRAQNGFVGPPIDVDSAEDYGLFPDIGGANLAGDMLIAYHFATGAIHGLTVRVDAFAQASLSGFGVQLSEDFQEGAAAVSDLPNGTLGNWLVAWEHGPDGLRDIRARMVSSDGQPYGAETDVWNAPGADESSPDVAMTQLGVAVIVADVEAGFFSGVLGGIQACGVTLSAFGVLTGSPVVLSPDSGVGGRTPTAAFSGTSVAVSFSADVEGSELVYLGAVHPFTLAVCDEFAPELNVPKPQRTPVLASAWPVQQGVLVACQSDASGPGSADLGAQLFRPATGSLTPLFEDGCGPNRTIAYCATGGNSNFSVRLTSDSGDLGNYLLISPARLDLPCGTCLLVPNPGAGPVIFVPPAIFQFGVSVDVPIPAEASGGTYYLQWLTVNSSPVDCPTLGVDLVAPVELYVE